MADLLVIYDPVREVAAIVVPEEGRAFGPAYIGEESADVLQAFIDATPWDMSDLGVFEACAAFASFLERNAPPETVAPDASTDGKVESAPSADVDTGDALAEVEAANASDVPAPAPADTDMESDPRTETVTVPCFNCGGSGMVEFGDGSPSQRCGMCAGTGKIAEEVPL